MRRVGVAALAAALLVAPAVLTAQAPPEGYRGEPYRAPVPDTLQGAFVIGDAAAEALWRSGRVAFVDVLPQAPKPADLPEGVIWRDPPHESIPGALWLPNTGYQALAAETERYLRDGLSAATEGDPDAPVVLFCQRDCWMSWNVAKRAIAHGFARVFWYPEGVDGWRGRGLPLERTRPWTP